MSHYFTDNQNLPHNRKDISFRFLNVDYRFVSDDGVFSKNHIDQGTEILLKVVSQQELQGSILDLGCGIGVIAICVKTLFPKTEVMGIDVNSRALECAVKNAGQNRVQVRFEKRDGTRLDNTCMDWVVANPPVRVGKAILYQLFDQVYETLKPGGQFIFVMRKSHGALSAQKKCVELFGNCAILEKSKGFYILYSAKR